MTDTAEDDGWWRPTSWWVQEVTDPRSLDYSGLLNLIWRTASVEVPCDMHPEYLITADGCGYCRRIRTHHNQQIQAMAAENARQVAAIAADISASRTDED